MLDIIKILPDIDNLGREQAETYKGFANELSVADSVINSINDDVDYARSRIESAKTSWLTANFDLAPDTVFPLAPLPPAHAVTASDGSQIMPDKNEAALCFLLNTSSIILYYNANIRPAAKTYPVLYYRENELWENDYDGMKVRMTDKLISVKRTLSEMNTIKTAIQEAAKSEIPAVALVDGSLILWTLQDEPDSYRKRALTEYLQTFEFARELGIPIAGYISDPGSKDFVNSMRIMLCDQSPVNCDKCIHKQDSTDPPCEQIASLKDSAIFRNRLAAGERSVLFTSRSKILREYGDNNIRVFYLNTGSETARIEIPLWAAENESMLNLVHAVCYDQSVKGRGYPVALAEAHEHAVIRSQDRSAFYELLERSLVKHGARITRSAKRLSKNY